MKNQELTTFEPKYMTVNEDTGELLNKYIYFHGQTKDYRFDARGKGSFNLFGEEPLLDAQKKPIKSFTFQPIQFRFFTADLFSRKKIEKWVEFLFVDEKNIISSILFNSTNVEPFENFVYRKCLIESKKISDWVITVTPVETISKKDPNKKWAIVTVTATEADKDNVLEMAQFCEDFKPFNRDSAKYACEISLQSFKYFEELMDEPLKIESQNIPQLN